MGRPRGSTWHSDMKIFQALLHKPRRFSEFEWALVEEYSRSFPDDTKAKRPEFWRIFVRSWRIPKKTLARRLKALVAKGWIIRKVLPEHGHHVEYSLNNSKVEEILKALPVPNYQLTTSQKKREKTVWVTVPLREEFSTLRNLPTDKVLEICLRLKGGQYVCPKCLGKGDVGKALNVFEDADGRFYCRSCGEEVSPDECDELLKEIMKEVFKRDLEKADKEIRRYLDAINKQLKRAR